MSFETILPVHSLMTQSTFKSFGKVFILHFAITILIFLKNLPHSAFYLFTLILYGKKQAELNDQYYITFLLERLLPTVGRFGIVTKDSLTGASSHERFWILLPDGSVLVGTSQFVTHQIISQCPILQNFNKNFFGFNS